LPVFERTILYLLLCTHASNSPARFLSLDNFTKGFDEHMDAILKDVHKLFHLYHRIKKINNYITIVQYQDFPRRIEELTPISLVTQEAEIRRIEVQSQPWANSSRDPILKKIYYKKGLVK
jgi:hypothetical protein